ncbi:TlpA disulfide reductase family protein [Marinilabilia salmonicolor]|jgi:peroxiredoxin|uniref:Peroxiredoxin n=1 Tax=Marinilabilia salmonicolor TaxID=989 RepID=A0A368V2H3_9BACT|nr:TlpA disulfide reductase family protein [Marinilabilia salmonicolor]RCW35292.1 peroxiredoxin [Marinilabilia salmonicolor]
MKKIINQTAILAFLMSFSFSVFGQEGYDIVEKGGQVPTFTINTEEGGSLSMKDFDGKVVLINFFATWCGPCRQEMPFLQKDVWEKYKDHSNFKMMSIGRGHTHVEVATFKEKQDLGFPMYGDRDKSIYSKFAKGYIPRNYIVDADGTIVYASVGFSKEEFGEMLALLNQLLSND